jgi:hypothetical protein
MILAATSLLSISAAMVGASTLLCTRSSAALLSITNLMLPGKAKTWLGLYVERKMREPGENFVGFLLL